jgi:hypothetical protein
MELPPYNNAMVVAQFALDAIRAEYMQGLDQFEACLRDAGSKVHCIAAPLAFFPDHERLRIIHPTLPSETLRYALWAGVNGPNEAVQVRGKLGISSGDNMARLAITGFLAIRR